MKYIFTLLSLLMICPLFAQENTPAPSLEELAAKIGRLEKNAERMEKRAERWDKIAKHLPEISGYIQLLFDWNEDKTDFSIKRARLNLQGDLLKDKLDYRLQLEFASPKIVDAFVQYHPMNELNFKTGQFKIPFTIFNTSFKPASYEFIDTPTAFSKLVGGKDLCGVNGANRDLGFNVNGRLFNLISYDFAVLSGSGINTKDSNNHKDITFRMGVHPMKALTVSGSLYSGKSGADKTTRDRYSAGVQYEGTRLILRGEWIGGKTGMADLTSEEEIKPLKEVTSSSWYVSGAFRFVKKAQVALRYDTFLQDTDFNNSRQTNYTMSLVWNPVKHFRAMINYTYVDYAGSSPFFLHFKGGNNRIGVMVTAQF